MTKNRLEAFSDGVLAIIITIMVLELKVPHGDDWRALLTVAPTLLTYAVSFIFIGIYWNNHHHMFHVVARVNGKILWANLHMLFWLSLVPFATDWIGATGFKPLPVAIYGVLFLMSAIAFDLTQRMIVADQGENSALAAAIGKNRKGNVSIALYAIAIPLAVVNPWISIGLYSLVGLIWLVPDTRIERKFSEWKA
ncbi:MAG: TMEM175 family protein [Pseudomonadota bacterium]|nr:TMEM175 family protein [Pseudomonadota bacterium]